MLIYLHEPCQEDNVIQALKTCHDPCGVNFLLNATAIFDQKHYFHYGKWGQNFLKKTNCLLNMM